MYLKITFVPLSSVRKVFILIPAFDHTPPTLLSLSALMACNSAAKNLARNVETCSLAWEASHSAPRNKKCCSFFFIKDLLKP
jgi:hypothetical protein